MAEKLLENLGEFEFWFPIDKANARVENGKRIVYGVASDETLDMDGEIVSSPAIKKSLNYLLKHGRIDYDHKSKLEPKYIIGEPLEAKFDNKNNFHIKTLLYKGLEIADQVWEQLKAGNNRLGWSVGGRVLAKAMQFDKSLNRRVSKITNALINHIALTPHPKNLNTFATVKPYKEWLKSMGDPTHNCCGMCEIVGSKSCAEMHKAISTSGGTALGTNPVIPQSLEKDVKRFKEYVRSKSFSTCPKKTASFLMSKGMDKETAYCVGDYVAKNKDRLTKLIKRRK